eukprot:2015214-Prymnesium_polylepis.1
MWLCESKRCRRRRTKHSACTHRAARAGHTALLSDTAQTACAVCCALVRAKTSLADGAVSRPCSAAR